MKIFQYYKELETNKIESVIEVYEKDSKAFAKIISISDSNRSAATCVECSGKRKNAAILGMNILTGLTKDGNEWSGGKILDPKNGKEYKCYLQLLDNNTLKLRGYIAHTNKRKDKWGGSYANRMRLPIALVKSRPADFISL